MTISLKWMKSEIVAMEGGNYQFQIGKKYGKLVDAFVKLRSC